MILKRFEEKFARLQIEVSTAGSVRAVTLLTLELQERRILYETTEQLPVRASV